MVGELLAEAALWAVAGRPNRRESQRGIVAGEGLSKIDGPQSLLPNLHIAGLILNPSMRAETACCADPFHSRF